MSATRTLQRVERTRVAPLIEEWLGKQVRSHSAGGRGSDFVGPIQWLAREAQISDRTLRRLRGQDSGYGSGETGEWVTFTILERLLIALDLTHLLYLDPEDGGFSDVY